MPYSRLYSNSDEDLILFVSGLAHHITAGINVLISVWLLAAKGGINAGLDGVGIGCAYITSWLDTYLSVKVKLVLAQYLHYVGLNSLKVQTQLIRLNLAGK